MARISLDPPKTLSYRIGTRFARRRYGVMLDPAQTGLQASGPHGAIALRLVRTYAA